jgi:hypothetical protein
MSKHLANIYGSSLLAICGDHWAADNVVQDLKEIAPGFDCFIVNRMAGFASLDSSIVEIIASKVGEWVEVFGDSAEAIHDAIDAASARIGRQDAIGDGNPMTTWQNDMSDSEIASYIRTGGQGSSPVRVLIIIEPSSTAEQITRQVSKL